ncbi:hypothetical protein [Actinomadura sp. WMMB 499]|uniref:hypothetical protein n=1 Tax=Actinomadura sp. WMMB 499 TaxID=1219491 RepID=UPI0034A0C0DE
MFLWDGFARGVWETEYKRRVATLRLRPFEPLPRAAAALQVDGGTGDDAVDVDDLVPRGVQGDGGRAHRPQRTAPGGRTDQRGGRPAAGIRRWCRAHRPQRTAPGGRTDQRGGRPAAGIRRWCRARRAQRTAPGGRTDQRGGRPARRG